MDWVKANFALFIFGCIAVLALLFLIIDFVIVQFYSEKISKKTIVPKSSVFGGQINFAKDKVILFNKKKVGKKKICSIEEFYKLFHNKDAVRIQSWISKISTNDEVEEYFETEILESDNKFFYCLLKFIKFDGAENIAYLEIYKYDFMPSSQGRKKQFNKAYSRVKKNQIESAFHSLKKKKGYIFNINFFFKVQEVISSEEIEKSVLISFKNEVYALLKSNRFFRLVLDQYENSLYVFDFKMRKEIMAEKLANDIYDTLTEFINIKGHSNLCGITIGIVDVKESNDFNELLNKSSDAAQSAQENDLPYLFYSNSQEDYHTFDPNIIEKVFKKDSLKYYFRPILNIENEQLVGYFGSVKCEDTQFENYFDIARYVNKVDRNRELLSNTLDYFVNKFFYEKPRKDSRLFLQISLVDLDHLCKVLNNISHTEEINLVLMFEETEVNANAFSLDLLHSQFSELKSLGYDIALLLKDENTLLESDFYENFNFFVIGSSMVSKVKESNRFRLSNRFLIESLLQYKRPIIITDLDGWASIELFIKSGCSLLSANDISPQSEMLLPIEKSKIARIRKIKI